MIKQIIKLPQVWALIAIVTLFLGLLVGKNLQLNLGNDISKASTTTVSNIQIATNNVFSEDKLWDLVQKFRSDNHLPVYIKEDKLCQFATVRSFQIKSDFSHDQFYQSGPKLGYKYLAENLSSGYISEQDTLTGWLYSASHSATLHNNYKYSCLKCSDTYCVQEFANK